MKATNQAISTIFIFILLFTLNSCKKDEIKLYKGDAYIQFATSTKDSIIFSFLSLPDDGVATIPLAVSLIGNPVDKDRYFSLSIDNSLSTATTSNYALPDKFVLHANKVTDTCLITLKNTAELKQSQLKLVVNFQPGDDLKVGQTEYSTKLIYMSDMITKPNWWTKTVESSYLGVYSNKKFELFIQLNGISDLNPNDLTLLRTCTVVLKNYLLKEKDAGRTVYEEDGKEMVVPFTAG